jgi:ribosomal protein S18 acetylase RimI-like enzyme
MSAVIEYLLNKASVVEIAEHLRTCETSFVPALSSRVEINDYAQKILSNAVRFEAWSDGILVGLVATYCNDQEIRTAYITSVSVLKEWTGKGVAICLMSLCIKYVNALGMKQICLEVASDNVPALRLYEKIGFTVNAANAAFVNMNLYLESGNEYE